MPGLFQGLEIGKNALLTNQYSLQTIGHNIANVNTPGFSRQRVIITSAMPERATIGRLGTGVRADGVQQARDLFLTEQYREAQKSLGQWNYKSKAMGQIESILNEPFDNSINDLLNGFWDAWSTLATNSDSASNRNLVMASANQLINGIRQAAEKLNSFRAAVDRDLANMTSDINRLTAEIANLNSQIKVAEIGNQRANDLRDQRDLLTDQLSRLIDVNTVEQPNGTTLVQMGSMAIVDGADAFPVETIIENRAGQPISRLVWEGTSVELRSRNGEMAGLLESRDRIVPEYQAKLDELAQVLVQQVNAIHVTGYGEDGTTGTEFFDPNNTTAMTISLNNAIEQDIGKIAAAATIDNDNQIALALSELRDSKVMSNDSRTINDFYTSLVGQVGVHTHEAESYTENYELLRQQVENSRQAVQGVSLDEEMANMVRYQHAYDAAARVITTMDQALDTVIMRMGVVGL
jgi:flagellar hook-associated protein 1 FlgK